VAEPYTIGAVVAVTVVTAVVGLRGMRVARTPADFMVAARQVPPLLNASAISGEYLSAASFLGIAGLALLEGLGALWYAVGYAAGYLVLLAAVAAPLRRFGAYTIPDFAEGRLGSPRLRRWATVMVLVICGFYLLPQLNGAGITLQLAVGGPYWIGVVVLGVVVSVGIASGGMKGITVVQAFLYWLKLTVIAVPALVLLLVLRHPPVAGIEGPAPLHFLRATLVRFPDAETISVRHAVTVLARGVVGGLRRSGPLLLHPGRSTVGAGSALRFPAGSAAPAVQPGSVVGDRAWASPLVQFGGRADHPLAATYGVLVATVFGAMGLPHILVRFYTNSDGRSARRTTALVLLLVSVFYAFPAVYAVLGRMEAPGLYVSGQADSVVLALPKMVAGGLGGDVLGALVAAGAFAAFLSTSSGLLIAMAGALSHDILGRGVRAFRLSALGIGAAVTAGGLAVAAVPINVLVGWAFAIAASSFCPLLLLGIWWPRLTRVGAKWGLALGGGASSAAVVADLAGAAQRGWPALLLGEPAIWTVPLAFGAMVVGSLATPQAVPANVTDLLVTLHLPERLQLRHGQPPGAQRLETLSAPPGPRTPAGTRPRRTRSAWEALRPDGTGGSPRRRARRAGSAPVSPPGGRSRLPGRRSG
jgi:Na+(H+)/acetate symporter ActP